MSSLQRRIATISDTTAKLISLFSYANGTGYAISSGKRCYQSGNRRNRNGRMGTALSPGLIGNRLTVKPPLAAADLLNRLPQPIDSRARVNSAAPTMR
jgi:hypothetical protein